MSDTPLEMISCGAAETLVKSLLAEPAKEQAAFASLLEFASEGLVRTGAARLRFSEGRFSKTIDQTVDPLSPSQLPSPQSNLIFAALKKAYMGDTEAFSHCCFKTGSFRFNEWISYQDNDARGAENVQISILGLKFCERDIQQCFDQSVGIATAKQNKGKAGAPRSWDWDGALIHLVARANGPDGLHPSNKPNPNFIGQLMGEWFAEHHEGEKPSPSLLWEWGSKVQNEIERLKLKEK